MVQRKLDSMLLIHWHYSAGSLGHWSEQDFGSSCTFSMPPCDTVKTMVGTKPLGVSTMSFSLPWYRALACAPIVNKVLQCSNKNLNLETIMKSI